MDELIYNLRRLSEWTAKELWENPVNFPEGVLKQAADELEKRRWIPVEERTPEQGEKVLALWECGPELVVDFAFFMDGQMGEMWRYKNWVAPPDAITHWMYLPEAPKEDEV